MNRAKRQTVIAGNWKMNKNTAEAVALLNEIKATLSNVDWCKVVVCVPFTDITVAQDILKGTNIGLGAQNIHWAKSGAFTGEISGDMLVEAGVQYVVIGHSERRQYFGETDITVNMRVKAALSAGLIPILCVGETLDQRELGITAEINAMQTKIALQDISTDDMKKIIIAYEPVWAIGTGKTATSEQANEVNGIIRSVVESLYSTEIAQGVTIQYGGSMNATNANELLGCEHIDGGLIGGASLKAADFATIINAANQ